VNDVQIFGGGGSYLPANLRSALFPSSRGGATYGIDRWGAQYPSIWVTRGGGGTFTNIWSPDTYAQGGFYVSDTKTPGHVYELSNEHHLFNEIKLERVENWDFLAPQTEEEAPTIVLTVTDATGQVIRTLTGPVGQGFHRVSWDLRQPAPTLPSLRPAEAADDLFFEEPAGPLVMPGVYRVSLAKRVEGVRRIGVEIERRPQRRALRADQFHLVAEIDVAQRRIALRFIDDRLQFLGAQQRHGGYSDAAGLDHGEPARRHHRVVRPAQQHPAPRNQRQILAQHMGDPIHQRE
jgi:hypothetical protein